MNVALIGTGLMGRPMAERILRANHQLVVFNRTMEKAEPLKLLGAEIASSAKDAIRTPTFPLDIWPRILIFFFMRQKG